MHPLHRPTVGITCDCDERSVRVRRAYVEAVHAAGGTPILLAPPASDHEATARAHAALCDAFILTGGDDPATEPYGEPTHPAANRMHPDRQRYEEALLDALSEAAPKPVLGVCLGMQLMALRAGGRLNQHLPDDTPTHADHAGDSAHPIAGDASAPAPLRGTVTSHHHQAVRDPGRLRILARAPDGVIEAIGDPARPYYLGVQWHPERTPDPALGSELFRRLVEAAGARSG